MSAMRGYLCAVFVVMAVVTDISSGASEDGLSLSFGETPEGRPSPRPTTHYSDRKSSIVTTAPPGNAPNLHPLKNDDRRSSPEASRGSDMNPDPAIHAASRKDPESWTGGRREDRPGNDEEGKTTSSSSNSSVQRPGSCRVNLTGPDGIIRAPPPSSSLLRSAVDCRYFITVYLGYGVEVQVMDARLSEGVEVLFEDLGRGDDAMLANESVLMRGLVIRSHSNQISIRMRSLRPAAASVLLRYQVFLLSCGFPGRPLYGDVSVSSLHSGGQAFFSCRAGYRLHGAAVLHCRNASSPYWSGREPRCSAACGGTIRNFTVGRIVSPGFPANYSNNLTCHWMLEAAEGQRLHVHFEKVALAEDDDRLLIRNGNSIESSALYDSYEVEYLPSEGLVSSSRHLFIELTTDAAGSSTGVAIRYQAFSAGHCYEPFVKYGNLSSSDRSWAVGAVVEFACEPGYTLEQGSVTIECIDVKNPQWNETEPACRAVCSGEMTDSAGVLLSPNWPEPYDKGQDCIWGIHVDEEKRIMLDIQVLNIGQNDLLTFYDGDDLSAKLLAQYGNSRPRFKLYASSADVTVQFQSDPATHVHGFGNGFVIHFFEVARNDTCPELPEISNGWKSSSQPELAQGTVVTYQCYPGFQLTGTELLMCQWDLTWSGDMPSCERVVTCAEPGQVDHSRRVSSSPRFAVGSTIQFICDAGFTLWGNSLLTCFKRGSSPPRWSQKPPRCLPESFEACRHPGAPTHGTPGSHKPRFQAGESLNFSCPPGRQLQGDAELRCIPGRPSRWSGPPPVCKAVSPADVPVQPAHVVLAVLLPAVLLLALVLGIGHFSRVRTKPLQISAWSDAPYESLGGETATSSADCEAAETKELEVLI